MGILSIKYFYVICFAFIFLCFAELIHLRSLTIAEGFRKGLLIGIGTLAYKIQYLVILGFVFYNRHLIYNNMMKSILWMSLSWLIALQIGRMLYQIFDLRNTENQLLIGIFGLLLIFFDFVIFYYPSII